MMEALATHAPVVGLMFFFVVFVCIAVWAYKPSNKKTLQQLAEIPLKDDHHE